MKLYNLIEHYNITKEPYVYVTPFADYDTARKEFEKAISRAEVSIMYTPDTCETDGTDKMYVVRDHSTDKSIRITIQDNDIEL